MERLMKSDPGLGLTFRNRIEFSNYSPKLLFYIAAIAAEPEGDEFEKDAKEVLQRIFGHVFQDGRVDQLGNARFAQSVYERSCSFRDLRVMRSGHTATTSELLTVTAADLRSAYQDLTGDISPSYVSSTCNTTPPPAPRTSGMCAPDQSDMGH
jgi:hypothetical protein